MALAEARSLTPILRDRAADIDAHARFPTESLSALRRTSLMGLLVPETHGGRGANLAEFVVVAQELAHHCLSTAFIWAMHCQQVDAIVRYGSPKLLGEVLPQVAQGDLFIGSVTTEPGKGGHLLSADAPLTAQEGGFTFERQAPIVTGGRHADSFLVTLRRSDEDPPHRVTLVYAKRAQLSIVETRDWDTLGMRATESVALTLQGHIPDWQVLGEEGEFREIAVESVAPVGHIAWSACWIGAAHDAFASAMNMMRGRAKTLSDLEAAAIAEARVELELAQSYLVLVAREVDAHRQASRSLDRAQTQIHLNALKVAASRIAYDVVHRLMDVVGLELGYRRDSPLNLERHLRDLRAASLNYANGRLLVVNGHLNLLDRSVRLAASDDLASTSRLDEATFAAQAPESEDRYDAPSPP